MPLLIGGSSTRGAMKSQWYCETTVIHNTTTMGFNLLGLGFHLWREQRLSRWSPSLRSCSKDYPSRTIWWRWRLSKKVLLWDIYRTSNGGKFTDHKRHLNRSIGGFCSQNFGFTNSASKFSQNFECPYPAMVKLRIYG